MGKKDKPEKPTNIQKIHKDDKTLDKASDKSQKPEGKVEKTLRAWLDDIDSED